MTLGQNKVIETWIETVLFVFGYFLDFSRPVTFRVIWRLLVEEDLIYKPGTWIEPSINRKSAERLPYLQQCPDTARIRTRRDRTSMYWHSLSIYARLRACLRHERSNETFPAYGILVNVQHRLEMLNFLMLPYSVEKFEPGKILPQFSLAVTHCLSLLWETSTVPSITVHSLSNPPSKIRHLS